MLQLLIKLSKKDRLSKHLCVFPSVPESRLLVEARLLVFVFCALVSLSASASQIVVLEFELKDLTLNPAIAAETERAATLRPLLAKQLADQHGFQIADNPESAGTEAAKGNGYLFERPEIAARIAREAKADWVVTGRLHKASFLFVYLKAQLIGANSGTVAADFVVEIKGPQKKLTIKGVETLAQQINDAISELDKRN